VYITKPGPSGSDRGLGTFNTAISGGAAGPKKVPPDPPDDGAVSLLVIIQNLLVPTAKITCPLTSQSPENDWT